MLLRNLSKTEILHWLKVQYNEEEFEYILEHLEELMLNADTLDDLIVQIEELLESDT